MLIAIFNRITADSRGVCQANHVALMEFLLFSFIKKFWQHFEFAINYKLLMAPVVLTHIHDICACVAWQRVDGICRAPVLPPCDDQNSADCR